MSNAQVDSTTSVAPEQVRPQPRFVVGAAPYLSQGRTTRAAMFNVVLAMIPLMVVAVYLYRGQAILLTVVTVVSCLVTEAAANLMRGQSPASLSDGSAIVTGMILAFSLPPQFPVHMAVIGGVVAIGLGKSVFGGLGQNLFNPAMVGRAFLMACFPVAMSTWSEPVSLKVIGIDAVTQATPLAAAKFGADTVPQLLDLFVGKVGGSIGETSALACIIGGLYLLLRGTADWRQPLGMLLGASIFAFIARLVGPDRFEPVLVQLGSGAMMFGAFFIATEPVGCPLTPKGRLIFGSGVGVLTMVIRLFGGYPEGVMFAVLMMNAMTPLIERWTIPDPLGGPVPRS